MVYYYLDIETYGEGPQPDPEADEIITITYCALDPETGRMLQDPMTLKSWESSEKNIVKELGSRMLTSHPFDFVPVGFSILFDLWFLKAKFKKYIDVDIDDKFYLNQPYLDLKQVMVFANNGKFKGVRIGAEGNPVQDWYRYQDYSSIERHVLDKLEKFLAEYQSLRSKL